MVADVTSIRGPVAPVSAAVVADREAILQLCQIYALALDTRDDDMLRSIFSPKATMRGWLGEDSAEKYLPMLMTSVKNYHATMHSILNQYAVVDGDEGNVWSYAVAYHVQPPGSGIQDLDVGIHYRDQVERSPRGWWIIRRAVAHIWSRGPMPPKGKPPGKA